MSSRHALIELLEECAQTVRRLEEKADRVIQVDGDQKGYGSIMRQKATLLAELYQTARPLAADLEEEVDARLERFSQSAQASLKVGSVFFMSALLYPEAHRAGEPNDLEVFIKRLKSGSD